MRSRYLLQPRSWHVVAETVGNYMQKTDLSPTRYRASQFPTLEQFEAMQPDGIKQPSICVPIVDVETVGAVQDALFN